MMKQATHDVIAFAGYGLATKQHDELLALIRELNPSRMQQQAIDEALDALLVENQYLGAERTAGTLTPPHQGVISPGSDRYCKAKEAVRVGLYARDLARSLDSPKLASAAQDFFIAATRTGSDLPSVEEIPGVILTIERHSAAA